MEQAEQSIQRAVLISLLAIGIAVAVNYFLTPLIVEFSQDLLNCLVFAIAANVIILFSEASAILNGFHRASGFPRGHRRTCRRSAESEHSNSSGVSSKYLRTSCDRFRTALNSLYNRKTNY